MVEVKLSKFTVISRSTRIIFPKDEKNRCIGVKKPNFDSKLQYYFLIFKKEDIISDLRPIFAYLLFVHFQNVRKQLPESLPGTGGGGNPDDNFLVKILLFLPVGALFFCYYRSLLPVCSLESSLSQKYSSK